MNLTQLLMTMRIPFTDPATPTLSDTDPEITRRRQQLIRQGLGGGSLDARLQWENQQMEQMKQLGIPPQLMRSLVQPPQDYEFQVPSDLGPAFEGPVY